MDKKGAVFNRETMFIVMGVLVAAFATLGMLGSAQEILDRDALFKNYLARDLALIIDAVYASPGDIEYKYPVDPKHTFYVRVIPYVVEVSSEQNFGKGETFDYRFAYDKNVEFSPSTPLLDSGKTYRAVDNLPAKEDLLIKPMQVVISKKFREFEKPLVSVRFEVAE
jgi:hypothetical protein